MKSYVGTKVLNAREMTLQEYNDYRGWVIPPEEDPTRLGYLVEYVGEGNPNHPNHASYISWSPADVFERTYQLIGPDVSEHSPHVQRALGELAELRGRVTKLSTFILSDGFKELPVDARNLLSAQLPVMLAYVTLLEARINGTVS